MKTGAKRVLTWHVHGNYLYYLTQTPHTFYLPVKPGRPEGFCGRTANFDWGDNVIEVPIADVPELDFDVILYQSERNYRQDQYDSLTPEQRRKPKIYLEHNAPQPHPTNTRHHAADDPGVTIVHVTNYNQLMWDNGGNFTTIIEHGVTIPSAATYSGELERGLVIINNIADRGRRLGLDVFKRVSREIPLDLIGMSADKAGGLGEIPYRELPQFMARYRFLFVPIRYSSLGLSVCEAMMVGLPVVGLATTELPLVIKNGVTGYVHTDIPHLIKRMRRLLAEPDKALTMSPFVRGYARRRFGIDRFTRKWENLLQSEGMIARTIVGAAYPHRTA